MYLAVYQVGKHTEFFTGEKPNARYWSTQKAEAFLFNSRAEALDRMRAISIQFASSPELKIQYIHPLNLPQR